MMQELREEIPVAEGLNTMTQCNLKVIRKDIPNRSMEEVRETGW